MVAKECPVFDVEWINIIYRSPFSMQITVEFAVCVS